MSNRDSAQSQATSAKINTVVGAVTPLAIAITMFLLDLVLAPYSDVVDKLMTCAFLCGTSTVLYALHYVFKDLRIRVWHRSISSPFYFTCLVPLLPLSLSIQAQEGEKTSRREWIEKFSDEIVPLIVAYICGYALAVMLAHITDILIFTLGFVYFIFMRLFIKWLVKKFSMLIPDFYRPRYLLLYGAIGGVGLSIVGALLVLLYVAVTGGCS